jgi:methylase of polypeptide subunit release factors
VVAVIDHLLATPEPQGPLQLVQPKVMYRFADEALEALSPGQKLLLRIGPAHARTVKQKLGEVRALIATPAPANN